ncbi:DNA repair protein RAD51 homolog 3-like [Rosa chinensis]|nr:DNA repair protein RAD51 homolog 3-like [Rosa chinensis]
MEVARLPLSASHRGKLISAGYTTLASLSSISPSDLARDLKVPESEAFEMLKVAKLGCGLEQPDKHTAIVNGAQTAWDILNEEKLLTRITTSCADLDKILGGGINCKEVTEIG